ncbi:MAG TPA: universal stress protein [Mucilaginibacter sp.]|nr:universal stress protein [Mucilaginibacter sp.]
MKTYIVPIDFSETSIHAAEFTALLSNQTDVSDIYLLHSYHVSVYESVLPTPDMIMPSEEEIEEQVRERKHKLEQLRVKMHRQVRDGVTVHVRISRSQLVRSIIETVDKEKGDLVILGSNGRSNLCDSHIGSNVVNISKLSPAPVVVVPPACHYELIKRVVMACDFNKVKDSIPLEPLKRLLQRHDVELQVVNIDKEAKHKNADPEQLAEETALHGMLKEYHPRYYYNSEGDIINGILNFAKGHHAQMVIALPHKYSFFQSLLHNSVSQQLTIHSAMPVLLLK